MKKTLCQEITAPHQYPVRLYQTGIDRFTVEYGLQEKKSLNYGQAAKEYGCCLMHALACAGLLDNRVKGEKICPVDRTTRARSPEQGPRQDDRTTTYAHQTGSQFHVVQSARN